MAGRLILIFLGAVLVNNFVLRYFLGICPFLGVTGKVESGVAMGFATTFVMTITAAVVWPVNMYIIQGLNLPFLEYVSDILIIASLVQLIEMFIKKTNPALYRSLGIYLPLITTNCSILFLALFIPLREYTFIDSIIFGFGAGMGFTFVLLLMSAIREELDFAEVPRSLRGAPVTLITAGLLALAFMGFTGLI
ncbi:RnfABCDGE type electron transport complex subunit A [Candidatus Aerophobetes bacterium]|nr:RnfABCDGE type electron transport complex subunit A [Candidatus Aerophobetes bacterium]